MVRTAWIASILTCALGSFAQATDPKGVYVEARNCDVWTGPCFANADFNLTGKNAVMAWKIDKGSFDDVSLSGLSVVAVIAAHNTLGLDQTGPAKAVLLVDKKATSQQREALVRFAQKQGGRLLANLVRIQDTNIEITFCNCKGETCAEVDAGVARIKTRCLNNTHDKACGNETAYYPPLALNVTARPAGVIEHVFTGSGLNLNWADHERRGAYVGSFAAN